jgi:hypothetical protein
MNLEIPLELEQIITTLLAQSKCACHVLNPHKTRILMWKAEPTGESSYHLRIGIQRFISQVQKDRSGKTYWRFYLAEPTNQVQTKPDEEVKTIAQPTPSPVESAAVQKFREKFPNGTSTSSKAPEQ